jgi:GT2 family glycosyltransferase
MRPAVDVVVPFLGDERALLALLDRARELELQSGDSLTVVDNSPTSAGPPPAPEVLRAPERQSSYYARNRGAARGQAPWLLFLDADVTAPPDLVDRYFADPIPEKTGVLAGTIEDVAPTGGSRLALRYAKVSHPLDDKNTWRPGFAYAQTASAAVRRTAFDEIGGFAEVRSGGDADLCFRMAEAGWRIERQPGAVVNHRSRATLKALIRQYMRYGAGAAWLEARYPGFAPTMRARPVTLEVLRGLLSGDGDRAARRAVYPLCEAAFAVGQRLSNDV